MSERWLAAVAATKQRFRMAAFESKRNYQSFYQRSMITGIMRIGEDLSVNQTSFSEFRLI